MPERCPRRCALATCRNWRCRRRTRAKVRERRLARLRCPPRRSPRPRRIRLRSLPIRTRHRQNHRLRLWHRNQIPVRNPSRTVRHQICRERRPICQKWQLQATLFRRNCLSLQTVQQQQHMQHHMPHTRNITTVGYREPCSVFFHSTW